MKFGFFLIFAAVMINCCYGADIPNVDGGALDRALEEGKQILHWLNTTTADEMEPKITKECLVRISMDIQLSDLVHMAEVNDVCYYVALYEFSRKYSHLTLAHTHLINTPKPKSLINELLGYEIEEIVIPEFIDEYYQNVRVRDYQLLLKTIKYFGCLLKRFDSNRGGENEDTVKVIFHHLNKYSSRSLVQLTVRFADVEWLTELKGPFPNVTEFKFTANHERLLNLNPKGLMITKKFPNLRRFIFVNKNGGRDFAFPIEHCPHLEYVRIEYEHEVKRRIRINKFLFQNPHIQHLEVDGFSGDYIMKIHSLLPNLEKLTFGNGIRDSSIDIKKPIHFEHLQSLHVLCSRFSGLADITFSNLEELRILYSPDLFQLWNGFFQNNHNFRRFEIEFISGFNEFDNQWNIQVSLDLIGLPSNIVEITIDARWYPISKATIVSILQGRPNLMKLTYITQTNTQQLKDEIQTDWNIRSVDNLDREFNGLEFTR